MANHEINIILRAKNGIAAGLASASGSVQAFGKSLKGMISASLGPIAAVIGAFMLLKKIIGFAQTALDAKNKTMREGMEQKAKADTEALAKSYDRLTKAIALRNEAIKNGQQVADIELKSTRALIDAQRELSKQKEMRGADPADKSAIEAINLKYAEIEATEKAAQKEADLRTRQRRLMDEAASARQEAIALGKEEEKQAAKAAELASKSYELRKKASSVAFQVFGGSGATEATEATAKAMENAEKKTKEQIQKTREAKAAAVTAAVQAEREAAAMIGEIQAAGVEKQALTLEQQNEASQKAAQARVDAEKKAADEIQAIRDEIAKSEDDRQKEIDAQHNAWQKKQLDDEMAANADKLAAAKDLAKKKIGEFIAEARQKKDDEKQEARDARKQAELEGRMDRGGKLAAGQAEWLAARQAIKGAQAGVLDLEAQKAKIERAQELLNQTEQVAKLSNINDELQKHNLKLDELLRWT